MCAWRDPTFLKVQVQWLQRNLSSSSMLCTRCMCALRLPLWLNFIVQKLHAYGFWPVCFSWWLSRLCFWVKALPHSWHTNGRTPVWIRSWRTTCEGFENFLLQNLQLSFPSLVPLFVRFLISSKLDFNFLCFNWCSFRSFELLKFLEHVLHQKEEFLMPSRCSVSSFPNAKYWSLVSS